MIKGAVFAAPLFLIIIKDGEFCKMKKRRLKKPKPQEMVWIILAITAVCVVIIFAIIQTQKKSDSLLKQAKAAGEDMVYENAYIVSNMDNKLIFICDGDMFCAKGTMEESYSGVADIEIHNSKIEKVQVKPDDIDGVMISYGTGQMQVSGQGEIPIQSEQIPVYDATTDEVREISISDLIIGSETLSYILDSGQICAIVRRQVPDLTYIRVLIKNDGSDFFPTVAVGAGSNLLVNDADSGVNTIDDMTSYMDQNGFSQVKISSGDNSITINGKAYKGCFEFLRYDQGVAAVNTIDVESYVRYVLPSEMPSGFSAEALKAQAVCARTYAYSQMKNTQYAEYGANIDNTTAYQVYNASGTYESTDRAVLETANQVVTCGGSLITCYYFSTSAGQTEDMEVWSSNTPEFIHKTESVDDNSPYYRWTSQIDLGSYSDPQYGTATGITVNKSSDSGFVLSLSINYGNNVATYTTENDIRKALGHFQKKVTLNDGSVRDNLSMIPSACFSVSKGENGQYTLSGGGFGHDIGLSQYGADKMAKNGASYKDIIGYYYKDVAVSDIKDVAE